MQRVRHDQVLTASALIAGLAACAASAIWFGRPFYADGAHYLLSILSSGEFLHVAWPRTGATLLTQFPMILALRTGASDLASLARIYGTAIYAPPLLAYAATTWMTRHDGVLFIGNLVVIVAVYFPTAFVVMGEFQILYAFFWCSLVMLLLGSAGTPKGSFAVLLLALVMAASYEVSLLMCPLLLMAAEWRRRRTASPLARRILRLAILPLVAGTVIGAWSILMPRDPANAGQFLGALSRLHGNRVLLGLVALSVLAGAASLVDARGRRLAATLIAAACLGFGWEVLRRGGGPALGNAYDQRAQVAPILLGVSVICGAHAWWRARRADASARRFNPWPLLLPALLVVALDLNDSRGWRNFLDGFCAALAGEREATAFPAEAVSQRYGWPWTYPTLSLLLRPAGSVAMVRNPRPGSWQPFDPDGALPDLERYKAAGGMCRLVGGRDPRQS